MTQVPGAATSAQGRGWEIAQLLAPWLLGALLLALMLPALRMTGMLAVLGLVGAAATGALLSVHPLVPFSFYFGALFFAETSVPGLGISANQVLAVLFFGSFGAQWIRGRTLPLESSLLPLLAAVALYYAFNAATGQDPERGPVHLRYVVIYFVLALCLAKSLATEGALLGLAWIVAGTTFLAACGGFLEAAEKNVLSAFAGKWNDAVRVKGTAKNSIVFGWNMVYAVPFSFLLYSQLRSASLRALALGLGFAAMAAATLTFNRQTYVVIGLEVALCAVLFRYPNRRALLTAVAALGILGSVTVLPMIAKRLLTVTEVRRDASFLERRDSFLVAMQMFREHPVRGVGLGSYPGVWKQYIPPDYPTYYMQYQEATRKRFPDFGYVALLAETGLLGLTAFVSLLATSAWRAWKLRRLSLAAGDLLPVNFSSLVLALLAYVGVTSAIQDTMLYPRVWILFALALLCDPRIWRREGHHAV